MGAFVTNFCVRDRTQAQLRKMFAGRRDTVIGPEQEGWCCFTDKRASTQDLAETELLGQTVTEGGVVLVSAMIHDSSVFYAALFKNGKRLSFLNTSPDYFATNPNAEEQAPRWENAEAFASLAPGISAEQMTARVLQKRKYHGFEFVDARQAHGALAVILGLPDYALELEYEYYARGERPAAPGDFVETSTSDT